MATNLFDRAAERRTTALQGSEVSICSVDFCGEEGLPTLVPSETPRLTSRVLDAFMDATGWEFPRGRAWEPRRQPLSNSLKSCLRSNWWPRCHRDAFQVTRHLCSTHARDHRGKPSDREAGRFLAALALGETCATHGHIWEWGEVDDPWRVELARGGNVTITLLRTCDCCSHTETQSLVIDIREADWQPVR